MKFFMNETYMTSHVHKFTCLLCFGANKIADKNLGNFTIQANECHYINYSFMYFIVIVFICKYTSTTILQ